MDFGCADAWNVHEFGDVAHHESKPRGAFQRLMQRVVQVVDRGAGKTSRESIRIQLLHLLRSKRRKSDLAHLWNDVKLAKLPMALPRALLNCWLDHLQPTMQILLNGLPLRCDG